MTHKDDKICPLCGGELVFFDKVKRIMRVKGGVKKWININRTHCLECGSYHRELPEDILPFKHYYSEIIAGVIEGLITSDTLGFEDYPCEMTMNRWRSQELQGLL